MGKWALYSVYTSSTASRCFCSKAKSLASTVLTSGRIAAGGRVTEQSAKVGQGAQDGRRVYCGPACEDNPSANRLALN